ncbi:MAG: filamentous hemagglutinin N-terminal domain-containing protein [Parachlamydiales bacterium]|nr:filamentous hemagglutinin N-terminal domain-containing protein [Parachlamydiales bacterium]
MKTFLFLSVVPCVLFSLPGSFEVHSGNASMFADGNDMIIRAGDQTILHWDTFSVGLGEKTRFDLPSSDSAILNRVLGSLPSLISGTLESNGKVLLINPNGVIFGKNSQVDTAAFIASTLDLNDRLFSEGKWISFAGDSQELISNAGTIVVTNGDLYLIGAHIENTGDLSAPRGSVLFGAARELQQLDSRFHVRSGEAHTISNRGSIDAMKFQAVSPGISSSLAFFQEGNIRAEEVLIQIDRGMCGINGSIHSPSLSVVAEEITLFNGSLLHGMDHPKTFAIGSPSTKAVLMEPEARIYIDSSAEAGSLTIFAQDLNAVYGKISGRGSVGADVDISTNGRLIYEGFADLTSPNGKNGTLRFDPVDITISTGAGTLNFAASCMGTLCVGSPCSLALPGAGCLYYPSGGAGFNINNATLAGQLAASNVILDASAAGAGVGTISFLSGTVQWAAATTLFLIAPAGGSILVNTIVQNTGVGAAAGNVSINMLGAGTINVTPTAGSLTAAIGSRNGLTNVCAPLADLNITGIATANTIAQLGGLLTAFPGAAAGTATGNICVDCAALNISGGSIPNSVSRIGHGYLMIPTLASAFAVQGDIRVDCDSLNMTGGGGAAGHAILFFGSQIGHLYPIIAGGTSSAIGNITVNCAGLLSLTGGIDENSPATIGHSYGNDSIAAGAAAIGTSQGDINITAGDVLLQGGTFNPAIPGVVFVAQAQIGHNSMGNTNSDRASVTNIGSITVNSLGDITLIGGNAPVRPAHHTAPAQIGHGAIGVEIDSTQLTNSFGNITVTAAGDIFVRGGTAQGTYAKIGHGDALYDGNLIPGSSLPGNCNGDILVRANGSINLFNSSSQVSTNAHIGHGIEQFISNVFVPPVFDITYSGNILVSANGLISFDSSLGTASSGCWIGHGSIASNGFSALSLTTNGNIDVFTTSTLLLNGGGNGSFCVIGHFANGLSRMGGGFTPQFVQGHTHVEANLVDMRSMGDNVMIGTQQMINTDIVNYISGSVEVISATDVTLVNNPAGLARRLCSIGVDWDTTQNPIPVFVAACNNVLLTNSAGAPAIQVAIQGRDDVYVAAGQDVVLSNNNTVGRTFIGSFGTGLTQIYAGNDVLASQTTGSPFLSYFGSGFTAANTISSGSSLTIRAAGDIVVSASFPISPTPAAGNIFIEADTGFSPGAAGSTPGSLWNFSGGTLNAIANAALPFPIPANEVFGCFQTNPTIPSDTDGGTYFNTSPQAVAPVFAAAGSVTINSASNGGLGVANLILAAPGTSTQLNIAAAGSICISGFTSGCGPRVSDFCQGDNIYGIDSYNNITINQALSPTQPAGGIYISANNTLTDNSPLTTTGGSIVLVSDNDRTGSGDLIANSAITSGSGLIFLQAGVYGTGSSSITQNTPSQITSASGDIVLSAASDINLLSSTGFAVSTAGFIHMIAGNNINMGSQAPLSVSISGSSIFTISGNDTNIYSSSFLNAPGTIRIVVDNNNCCPNSLSSCRLSNNPGILNMEAAAAMTGGAIQIYTAFQGSSVILGTLNGFNYGVAPYLPGTVFEDSSYEQWCSCCGCFGCSPVRIGNAFPFMIFYKPCLQLVANQALVVVSEFLVDLHPANEFPGWVEKFMMIDQDLEMAEPYYLRRRHLIHLNHPKSWTILQFTDHR